MEKQRELTESFFCSAAEANPQQELAMTMLAGKIIDIATTHANALGIGNPFMPAPSMGWVLSRLTIDLPEPPALNSSFTLTTWVEGWNRHFSTRDFCIATEDGKVCGYARTVWMVLDTETRANAGLAGLDFDTSLISDRECPIPRQARHRALPECPAAPLYRFKYCDLDAYRHVNTLRYLQIIQNQMPLEVYDRNRLTRIELSFLHEARYGDTVRINRADDENGTSTDFCMEQAADGTPVLYARTFFTPRK